MLGGNAFLGFISAVAFATILAVVSGNCSRSGSGAVEAEVVGVHNGIIENYTELKEKLLKHGYTFYSQTDIGRETICNRY
jgi:glucosamine 6-phosphate synthetase-like amidotransferase/phosphosugar isomerase protein